MQKETVENAEFYKNGYLTKFKSNCRVNLIIQKNYSLRLSGTAAKQFLQIFLMDVNSIKIAGCKVVLILTLH